MFTVAGSVELICWTSPHSRGIEQSDRNRDHRANAYGDNCRQGDVNTLFAARPLLLSWHLAPDNHSVTGRSIGAEPSRKAIRRPPRRRREAPLLVQIRPIAEKDVRWLEWHLAQDHAALDKHRRRFERQEASEVVYLVAWYDETPIGHVLLEWAGAGKKELASIADCPDLEDLFVHPGFRSRRVGSQLLAAAEATVQNGGYTRVGLAVALDNPRARSLYLKRGYEPSKLGPFLDRWNATAADGSTHWVEKPCIYLVKSFGSVSGSTPDKAVETMANDEVAALPNQ